MRPWGKVLHTCRPSIVQREYHGWVYGNDRASKTGVWRQEANPPNNDSTLQADASREDRPARILQSHTLLAVVPTHDSKRPRIPGFRIEVLLGPHRVRSIRSFAGVDFLRRSMLD